MVGFFSTGCEFLGKGLHPASNQTLKKLMIDHNNIGTAGLANLVLGVGLNPSLTHLSLSYCGLDKEAGKSLQLILAFIDSQLEGLNLQGNALGAEGVGDIFKALRCNSKLTELNLSDNKFSDDNELTNELCQILSGPTPSALKMVDLKYNDVKEENACLIMGAMKVHKKTKIDLTDRFSKETSDEYNAVMKSIKNKKGKKKKGKGKKKK